MLASFDHPTPDRRRAQHVSLDGEWRFSFDDEDVGIQHKWYREDLDTSQRIVVPFAPQTKRSGIDDPSQHEIAWYSRRFTASHSKEERLLLHFGAVDFEALVFVDGTQVAHHIGGHSPFEADITDALNGDKEQHFLVVRALDRYDQDQARGKQTWRKDPRGTIWYTATTGIWQSVWLETVPATRIDARTLATWPDFDTATVTVESDVVQPRSASPLSLEVAVTLGGKQVSHSSVIIKRGQRTTITSTVVNAANEDDMDIGTSWRGFALWSPASPVLYDVEVRLMDEQGRRVDSVWSYFGMRKVSIEHGKFCLNGRPFYQKLVLDQGCYADTGLTAPSDDAMIADIELAKRFGFNGCRKHQKPEEPRFLYHADRLGYLVWAEMADAYTFTPRAVQQVTTEWLDLVRRDLAHPSIVTWLIVNESWGVPAMQTDVKQRDYATSLVHLTKAIDSTRPVIASDGWHTVEASDMLTVHDYSPLENMERQWKRIGEVVKEEGASLMGATIFAKGHRYRGQPIIISEFGGVSLTKRGDGSYAQHRAEGEEAYLDQLRRLVGCARFAQGFCLTQLTDVETETNGLVDIDRKVKIDPSKIKAIIDTASNVMPKEAADVFAE